MAKVRNRVGAPPSIGVSILTALLLVFGVWYLVTTLSYDVTSSAMLYVTGCAVAFVVLAVVELAAQAFAHRRHRRSAIEEGSVPVQVVGDSSTADDTEAADDKEPVGTGAASAPIRWRVFAPMLAAIAGFAYVATQVDYMIGTAVFMVLAIILIARRRMPVWLYLTAAAGAVVLVHLIFVMLLQASLPSLFGLG